MLCAVYVSNAQQRVLYGENAKENEFPWMATLYDDDFGYHCGASLIADRWVITARHCVPSEKNLKVIVNPYYQSKPQPYAEEYKVVEIHFAPGSDEPFSDGYKDIVLLKLDKPALVDPIKLAQEEDEDYFLQDSFPASVLGWGLVDTMFTLQDTLKIGKPVLFSADSCISVTKDWDLPVNEWEICAGFMEGTPIQGGASGDSGGPLFIEKNNEYLQVGVVSRGNSLFTKLNEPGIYFNVATLQDWITETISETVSVKNTTHQQSFDVKITNDLIHVSKLETAQAMGKFYVVDILGNVVRNKPVDSKNYLSIDINSLLSGMYFLIYEDTKQKSVTKFVKK